MKPSKTPFRIGALGLFLANSQSFWSVFAAVAFATVSVFAYGTFFEVDKSSSVLSSADVPEPLTGELDEIYSESLITMIDRMDADIDDAELKGALEAPSEGRGLGREELVGKNLEEKDVEVLDRTFAEGFVASSVAENVFANAEAFIFQALDESGELETDTLLAANLDEESLGFNGLGDEGKVMRSDPFAPLVFDDGTGSIQIVGGAPDPIETDPTKDVQFMGVIGDAEGNAGDAVAILRLNDGSALGSMVMRAGDSFDIKGETAVLEKVESERVLVKLAGESHYVDLATFVDTVVTTSGDGSEAPPSGEGLPSEGAGPDEEFENIEEL